MMRICVTEYEYYSMLLSDFHNLCDYNCGTDDNWNEQTYIDLMIPIIENNEWDLEWAE